mmetsp:Transcript_22200/g.46841  ORF Transcript_22200/g.46841 Transcript_22200/m.46841 type:complete len:229 (+) Transcript_22200:182-868(+)
MLTTAKELKRSALVFPSTYTHRTVPLLRLLIILILLLHHCDGTVHQHGAAFAEEVACWLRAESLFVTPFNVPWLPRSALMVGRAGLQPCMALHLLPTPQSPAEVLSSSANVDASDEWETRNVAGPPLVHLWQDEWMEKSDIVRSRLLAMTGKSERIMARKTFVRRINAATLENFLQENHLWGPTQGFYRVHDAGARRLVLLRRELPDSNAFANSSPKYPSEYYLSNPL